MQMVINLLKARSHKYISRKKDAKGNWVYTYQEKDYDKKTLENNVRQDLKGFEHKLQNAKNRWEARNSISSMLIRTKNNYSEDVFKIYKKVINEIVQKHLPNINKLPDA